LRLENPRIAVAIDPQNGAIQSIRDKQQNVLYPQTGLNGVPSLTNGLSVSASLRAQRQRDVW
jgi:hypothetical protein